MKQLVIAIIAFHIYALAQPASIFATDPSPAISKLTLNGQHFDALNAFYTKGEDNRSIADILSAARSAWSVGLVQDARSLWDSALSNENLGEITRARTLLARAVLELQEREYSAAISFSQHGIRLLENSDLRAQFYLVLGESFKGQNVLTEARKYYEKAITEGSGNTQVEARYLKGKTERQLGLIDAARQTFVKVPMSSPFALRTLMQLIEIDTMRGEPKAVLTWSSRLHSSLKPEQISSKFYYLHIIALVATGEDRQALQVLEQFREIHSTQDSWFLLASAVTEQGIIKSLLEQQANAKGEIQ